MKRGLGQSTFARGFSIIEVGIVIAVIAVLAAVVITGAGFIRSAKERNAMDLVMKIRDASRQYSMRHRSGLDYGVSTSPADPNNTTLIGLVAESFLPNNLKTPWGSTQITVNPVATPDPPCGAFACISISMQVPPEICRPDPGDPSPIVVSSMADKAISVTCQNTTYTIVMR